MLKTEVREGENFEKALRRFKRKFRKTKVLQELKERRHYTKLSAARRHAKEKATYTAMYRNTLQE